MSEQTDVTIPTWRYNGAEYPAFVVNKEDSVVIELHDSDKRKLGTIGAQYRWEKSDPFREHLNLNFKEIRDTRENESESQRKNLTRQNCDLFKAIQVGGFVTKIVDGEPSEPETKTYEEMLRLPSETQSSLIDKWLASFFIERFFAEGANEIDLLFSNTDTVSFICKIGNSKSPSNIILIDFDVPSDDARRDYEDSVVKRKRQTDGTDEIINIDIDYDRKLRYAKKYLRAVQGAVVPVNGTFQFVSNPDTLKIFKDSFNPEWLMRLADALQDSFDIGGK